MKKAEKNLRRLDREIKKILAIKGLSLQDMIKREDTLKMLKLERKAARLSYYDDIDKEI